MKCLINEDHIKENLKIFSFPRLSGTKFEEKAFELAKKQIEDLNLKPEIQTFKFSTFYSRIYPKITFPIMFWVIFCLFLNVNITFILLNFLVAFLILVPFFIITRNPENIRVGRILESQNMYVKLNSDSTINSKLNQKNEIYNIFFIAHLDSKGQTITVRLRAYTMLLLMLSIISISIILILRSVLSAFLYSFFTYIGIIPIIGLFLGTLIFTLNKTNNKSKGVVDNASGVVCVLELLTYLASRQEKLDNCVLWFVLTGAEESGTMGIRYFHKILDKLNPNKTIVNNFESLGKSINILASKSNLVNNPDYYNYFVENAKNYNFRALINPFTRGIHTDGIYLLRKRFNTFEYGSSEVGKYMHSEKDSLQNVDTALIVRLCEFIIDALSFKGF